MNELTDRARAAYHESAHCVVSLSLGLRPESVVLIGDGPEVSGRMRGETASDPIDGVAVQLAGQLAEIELGVGEATARDHAVADLEEAWRIAGATDLPGETIERGGARARGIVRARWASIAALAGRLEGRVFALSGQELDDALAAASGSTLAPGRLESGVYPAGLDVVSIMLGPVRFQRFADFETMVLALHGRDNWRRLMGAA